MYSPKKCGRKPKDFKYPDRTLKIKRENIKIIFDENCKGDLKDLLMGPSQKKEVSPPQE
jgi:hypothetical protein